MNKSLKPAITIGVAALLIGGIASAAPRIHDELLRRARAAAKNVAE